MLDTVRARLTLWYVSLLAAILVVVLVMVYVLLARALYVRIDDSLQAVVQIAATSLANDLAEGQTVDDAARSTAAELASRQQLVAIYDGRGRLLGEAGREDDIVVPLPPVGEIPADGDARLMTIVEADDLDDRHRLALRRVTIPPGVEYVIVVGSSLEPTDEELESLRGILAYLVPLSLVIAGIGGWFLARPQPVTGGRDGRSGAEDRRREPECAAARGESARRARAARRDIQRAAGAARNVGRAATAVHGRRLARAAHAGHHRADCRQSRPAAADAHRS